MAPETPHVAPFAAVVLAGGSGRRLGGVDKAGLDVGGATLLDRTLIAVSAADRVVVVGPPRVLQSTVITTQEQPPGGGPVAALAAGVAALGDASPRRQTGHPLDLVVVLACDMPFVDAAAVEALVAAAAVSGVDGAALVDESGRRQHLAAAYKVTALRDALADLGELRDAAMRDLAKRLTVVEIQADPETTLDCDTWPDVQRTRDMWEER